MLPRLLQTSTRVPLARITRPLTSLRNLHKMAPSKSHPILRKSLHLTTNPVPPPDTRPIIISGPSGVGKGTLYKLLFTRHPETFVLSVSHTTRSARPGEQDGVDYHFVTPESFESLVQQDGFLEHAQFGGNRYGTPKSVVDDAAKQNRVVVLDIEMEGVKQVKNTGVPARYVFVKPPAPELETLEKRLSGRGTEKPESIQKRLAAAKVELEYAKTPGVHDLTIVNGDLETAYKELENFIYKPVEKA
jgi:guanylate kinase